MTARRIFLLRFGTAAAIVAAAAIVLLAGFGR